MTAPEERNPLQARNAPSDEGGPSYPGTALYWNDEIASGHAGDADAQFGLELIELNTAAGGTAVSPSTEKCSTLRRNRIIPATTTSLYYSDDGPAAELVQNSYMSVAQHAMSVYDHASRMDGQAFTIKPLDG